MRLKRLLPLFLLGVGTLATIPANALIMSGSDLFGAAFREALLAEIKASGIEPEISFDGSLLGLRDLEAGTVEASLLAIPDSDSSETALRKYPIGYQIVGCVVHASNPISQLTFGELVNLYKDNGTIEDWSDLTPDPTWRDRKVSLMASRRTNAVTLELFNAMVLQGERLKPSVRYLSGDGQALLTAVSKDPTVMILVPSITLTGPVKFLAVKKEIEDQAYTPSRDNVFFGDYPLRLPFYLVVADSLDAETTGLILKALYSDSVTAALSAMNFLPVPEQEQRSLLASFK